MLDFISQQYSDGMRLPNGDIARNLEAQVQKNKEDIANHYNIDRVLADFGIRVIGQVDDVRDLPEAFEGPFGDAYAVGVEPPYSFYIWTRADIDAGHPADYWFDVGRLAIVGPQGPQGPEGPKGETGERGSEWDVADTLTTTAHKKNGDMLLTTGSNNNGNIYYLYNGVWRPHGNIRGPQGIQGPVGPQGEQGPIGPKGERGARGLPSFIYQVVGTVANTEQLPAPDLAVVSVNDAYLVGEPGHYLLYVAIDEQWHNLGPITLGLEGGSNEFIAYDLLGNQIGASLFNNNVIFRNFRTDSASGLVNGALTVTFFDTMSINEYSQERGRLYDYLMKYGYTSAANNYMPCSGFALETPQRYEYFGIAANPNVEGQLYFVGYRYNIETGAMKQASWGFDENSLTKYYRSHLIPPGGNL